MVSPSVVLSECPQDTPVRWDLQPWLSGRPSLTWGAALVLTVDMEDSALVQDSWCHLLLEEFTHRHKFVSVFLGEKRVSWSLR